MGCTQPMQQNFMPAGDLSIIKYYAPRILWNFGTWIKQNNTTVKSKARPLCLCWCNNIQRWKISFITTFASRKNTPFPHRCMCANIKIRKGRMFDASCFTIFQKNFPAKNAAS